MARNQFSFQKRQKELAKKKKREEKRTLRAERKEAGITTNGIATVNEFGEVIESPVEERADEADETTAEEPRD